MTLENVRADHAVVRIAGCSDVFAVEWCSQLPTVSRLPPHSVFGGCRRRLGRRVRPGGVAEARAGRCLVSRGGRHGHSGRGADWTPTRKRAVTGRRARPCLRARRQLSAPLRPILSLSALSPSLPLLPVPALLLA